MMILLSWIFEHTPKMLLRFLAFLGTISLELYLIHVEFVLKNVKPYHLGYWLTLLTVLVISIILAWILNKTVEKSLPLIIKRKHQSRRFPHRAKNKQQ